MIRYQNVRPVGTGPAFLNGFTPFPELGATEIVRGRFQPARSEVKFPVHSIDPIIESVCAAFGVTVAGIKSERRARDIARPRFAVCLLAQKYTGLSTTQIGRCLGNRDHTTVMRSFRVARELVANDPDYRRKFEQASIVYRSMRKS